MKRLAKEYGKLIAALLAIFLSGQVFGFVLASRHRDAPATEPPNAVAPDSPPTSTAEDWTTQAVARLTGELDLRPDQVAALEPIARSAGREVARERERALFQIHLQILALHDEIAPLLDTDQTERLTRSRDALDQTIRSRFAHLLDESHGHQIRE